MPGEMTLRAIALSKRYGTVVALDRVSLEVRRGECVALIGESGSGKTTLLRCFNRLTDPDAGQVLVDGADVAGARSRSALRRRVGYVPQDGGLLPHWRVRRNVALVPWLRGQADADAQADRALRLVGLEPAAMGERWPRELSGGQRQRVAVARALAARAGHRPARRAVRRARRDHPRRPAGHVPASSAESSRVTTLLVTHDLAEALLLADRIAVMHAGPDRAGRPRPTSCAPRRRPSTCARCWRGRGCAR